MLKNDQADSVKAQGPEVEWPNDLIKLSELYQRSVFPFSYDTDHPLMSMLRKVFHI